VAHVLTRRWLLWVLAAVFWARVAVLDVLAGDRPDAVTQLAAGRRLVLDPAHVYDVAAARMAATHLLPLQGFLKPPAAAVLAAPFGLMPEPLGVALWSAGDAAALAGALLVLERLAAPRGWHRPLFWLVAGYFPATLADLASGQMGGYILLLAAGSLALAGRRSAAAGALAGLAAALKLYPAAMPLGAGPARLPRYAAAAALTGVAATAAAFAPLGPAGARLYLGGVLGPALRAAEPDCGVDSVHTLFGRLVAGDPWVTLDGPGMVLHRSPLHAPVAAEALFWASAALLVAAAVAGARRSGWHPVFGPSLALALGALLPPETYVYQQLPLLPVVLLVTVRSVERHRWGALAALGVALLGMVRPPCLLPVPDLWTLSAVALYAVAVWQSRQFRDPA
jgi:hypothetical protein